MPATKVTLLFGLGTVDASGNAARSAGWSESYYSTLDIASPTLQTQWTALAQARAGLLPANARIVGSRYQQVDPVGGSRSYDNVYPSNSTAANDLPGMALQWTLRSLTTPNQRSLILRGVPDGRVSQGEYVPTTAFNNALIAFFAQLKANWRFRSIDRAQLPVQIISVSDTGIVTTGAAHGLVAGDTAIVMSAVNTRGVKHTAEVIVQAPVTATTFAVFVPRLKRDESPTAPFIYSTVRGRVRKKGILYPQIDINTEEIINPTATHRKAGSPFRKFRGRRTGK